MLSGAEKRFILQSWLDKLIRFIRRESLRDDDNVDKYLI